LRRAWYSLNQAFRRRLAPLGLTPDQFTALRILIEGDARGLTQRQLTHVMSSDPNTVASLVRRMEKAGLVKRRPHEHDRRAHRIHLQSGGQKKYEAARALAVQLQSEVLAVLPPERREDFLEHLICVAEACRQAAAKSPAQRSKRGKMPGL
jgi:DNA-binding MarR family transcriptional regulator